MANKTLFKSLVGKLIPIADARNEECAPAYALTPKHALAQYAATGCLGATFYANASEQLAKVLELCEKVEPAFIAKTAIYARERGLMKDSPALLLAVLASKDVRLLAAVFPRVVDIDEILSLVRGFDDCTLPREEWTHAAHLTVALWHLLQFDWTEALIRVRAGIKRYNAAHGIVATPTGGYHETLTRFWLRHVRTFLEDGRNEARSLVSLANDLVACSDKNLPLAFYTRERLFSPEARVVWIEPDLQPLA